MRPIVLILFILSTGLFSNAQVPGDSSVDVGKKLITLSNFVINNKLNVPAFIEIVKNDSSFYKAFKNLHIINFTAINDIRMNNKNGELNASLFSRTKQTVQNGCRTMKVLEEKSTGDMYNDSKEFNYYTANMYASLFFTK